MSENWNTLRRQIEYFTRPFPRSAIAFANEHRDEVAPFLIKSLSDLAKDPLIASDREYALHFYAMHLLAVWRDTRAYEPLVALGHHSEDILDLVLGDSITESYGRSIAAVCDGDTKPLQILFENTQASHWARNAALNAWMVCVLEGDSSRDELLQYLIIRGDIEAARLRQPNTVFEGLEVLDSIVSVASSIGAIEMSERINGWFSDNLLDTFIADNEWVQQHIRKTFDTCREYELRFGKGYVRDVAGEMSNWSGFRDKPKTKKVQNLLPQSTRNGPKVGRNDPCSCGSGKKFKKCCGAATILQ